jgi:hypothetical protein
VYSLGTAYLVSLFVLTAVVVAVYSASQEAHLTTATVVRRALRRAGKLLGVLAILAIAVYILSKI